MDFRLILKSFWLFSGIIILVAVASIYSKRLSLPPRSQEDSLQLLHSLKAGYGKADALAKSKQDFLQSATTEFKHPYYWAGLVLIGDNEKMNFSRWNKWIVIFTSLTGTLLLISIIKLSKNTSQKLNMAA